MLKFDLRRYGPKKNWYVFWTEEGGRSQRWSTRTTDQSLAKKRQKAFVHDQLFGKNADPADTPISTVLSRYMNDKDFKGRSLEVAAFHIKRLAAYFDDSCRT
jgi:hypothetical protein